MICTLTGFVVVMAHCWTGADAENWQALDKLPKYTESIAVLTPGTAMNGIVTFLVTLCFCLFAFTCLLGMISFRKLRQIVSARIRSASILYVVSAFLLPHLESSAILQDWNLEISGRFLTLEIF